MHAYLSLSYEKMVSAPLVLTPDTLDFLRKGRCQKKTSKFWDNVQYGGVGCVNIFSKMSQC